MRRCVVLRGAGHLLGLVILWGFAPFSAPANPNCRDPQAPLEIHNLVASQPLLERAQELYADAASSLQGIAANPARVSGKGLSQLHIKLRQLRRTALELELHGETAGADYYLRAQTLGQSFGLILNAFKSTPAGTAQANQIRQFLASPRQQQTRATTLQSMQRLAQQEKWPEAYTAMNEALDQLTSMTTFLGDKEEQDLLLPWLLLLNTIEANRHKLVRQQLQTALEQVRSQLLPNAQGLLQEIATAAGALRTNAQAAVGGQMMSGPQCLEHFGKAWTQTHVAALRCRAADWARMAGVLDASFPQTAPPPPPLAEADHARFQDEWVKAVASLIAADAGRAADHEVAGIYLQYVQVLTPLLMNTADAKLTDAARPALDGLARKSPAFAAEVNNYYTATHEWLRWREKLAAASAQTAAAPFVPSDKLMVQATVSSADFRGLLDEKDPKPAEARLLGPSPQVVTMACQRAVDQKIVVHDTLGPGAGKLGATRYHLRHYAMIAPPDVSGEVLKLKQDLLVSEHQPALSLESVVAIASAERGDFVAVGGTVKGLHVEGLIPRLATLRPEDLPLVPLGPLPAEAAPPHQLLSQVLVRFDVLPAWVRHKYFFTSIPPTPAAKSGGSN